MSTRSKILANIKETLDQLFEIKTVLISKFSLPDLDNYPLPICFIFSGAEIKEHNAVGFESWRWSAFIETWGNSSDMEDLLKAIHDAMAVDETLGGDALDCERIGCSETWLVSPENDITGMVLEFEIRYRHSYGVA